MEDSEKEIEVPSTLQKTIIWKAITGISFAVIIILIISSITIIGKVLNLLQPVLVPVAIAAILSYLLSPLVHWIRKKALKDKNLSRTKTILIIYSALVVLFIAIALLIIIPASSQLSQLIEDREKIIDQAQVKMSSFSNFIESFDNSSGEKAKSSENIDLADQNNLIWDKLMDWVKNPETSKKLLNFLGKTANGFIGVLGYGGNDSCPRISFFFLRDSAFIERNWDKIIPLKDSSLKDEIVSVVNEINEYRCIFQRTSTCQCNRWHSLAILYLRFNYAIV